jgi:hypothetical protein
MNDVNSHGHTQRVTSYLPLMSEQAAAEGDQESLVRRSWSAVAELLSPFSATALALLPKRLPIRPRSTRNDDIPEVNTRDGDQQPTVRDYHAINSVVPEDVIVRVPKKFATPIKVEAKVWFANERSERLFCSMLGASFERFFCKAWISWLNNAVIIATMAAALFNASRDQIGRNFAYFYGFVSFGVLVTVSILRKWVTSLTLFLDIWLFHLPETHNYDSPS